MTITNLGLAEGARLIGPVKENFNWQITLIGFVVILAIAWLLLQFLSIIQQEKRVKKLDALAMASNK